MVHAATKLVNEIYRSISYNKFIDDVKHEKDNNSHGVG